MTKRESGWYRVYIGEFDYWEVLYFDVDKWWYGESVFSETTVADCSFDVHEMVMNSDGQIVYNQTAHDTLYNTKQEG